MNDKILKGASSNKEWSEEEQLADPGPPAAARLRRMKTLVPPHGGALRPLLVADERRRREALREAGGLPRVRMGSKEVSDAIMLASGAFSPLPGFLGRDDYLGVVRRLRLADGLLWPIPVTLAVSAGEAEGIREGGRVALLDAEGEEPLALMTVREKYRYSREEEAREVFGTAEQAHPGVEKLFRQGEVYLGGPVEALGEGGYPAKYPEYARPAETRALFAERGWSTVAAFQTRNPLHRSHEYLLKIAMEVCDGVLLHPVVGALKKGDIPAEVRLRCYQALLARYYPRERIALRVYPMEMRYAGPREALLHAIIRQNFGCSHLVVGRDHAGVGKYYGPFDAQAIFETLRPGDLAIRPLKLDNTFWCRRCGEMASAEDLPARRGGPPGHQRHGAAGDARRGAAAAGGVQPPGGGRDPDRILPRPEGGLKPLRNVILFTIDTLRRDALGLYAGDRGHTPFLDSLAHRSLVFTRAYSAAPYTQASFPALLTSSYQFDAPRAQKLSPRRTLISEALQAQGVATAAFHSNPYLSGYFGWNRGWDRFYDSMEDDVDDYSPYIKGEALNRKVDAWLASRPRGDRARPLFLWVHYMDVHEPYVPDRAFVEQVDASIDLDRDRMLGLFKEVVLPRDVSDPRTVALLHQLYRAHVREVDGCAKELFQVLEKHGLLENSSVIVTTDHGDEFGEHGGLSHDGKMFDELVHVPQLVVNPPEGRGESCDRLVSGLDVPPTIMGLFNLAPHPDFQGRSLFPLAGCPEAACYGEAVGKLSHRVKETDRPAYFCREGRLKVTYREEEDRWALFDLVDDPGEKTDIIDSSPQAEEMKHRLLPRLRREPKWKE